MCIEAQVNNNMFNTCNNNNLYVIWTSIYNRNNQTWLWLLWINLIINLMLTIGLNIFLNYLFHIK
jgi:hypothetical protein